MVNTVAMLGIDEIKPRLPKFAAMESIQKVLVNSCSCPNHTWFNLLVFYTYVVMENFVYSYLIEVIM